MKIACKGFTLVEILITTAILALCLCGLLASYVNMFSLSDLSRDFLQATNAVQAKTEEIKKTNFDNLSGLNATAFDIAGFSAGVAKGLVEVSDTAYADLKRVRVVVCFKSRGRLFGDDTNLNGALNAGEDVNNNGRLDSPAEIVTLIAK